MNRLRVWVPPDGDHRLHRVQDALVEALGAQGVPLPPYLPVERVPEGPVVVESWVSLPEIALSVRDDMGDLGFLRFGLTRKELGELPPIPRLSWTKGRLVDLEIVGSGPFEWTWKNSSGWTAYRPRG